MFRRTLSPVLIMAMSHMADMSMDFTAVTGLGHVSTTGDGGAAIAGEDIVDSATEIWVKITYLIRSK